MLKSKKTNEAPPKGGALYQEIEIGPHFLTFYTKDYQKMLEDGEILYTQLNAYLQIINPKSLVHQDNDPNIYHPFGEPNNFRPYYRHFHIRYGRKPTIKDIRMVLRLNLLNMADGYKISNLEDNKDSKFQKLEYPVVDEENYLEYLQMLRKGDWINGK